VAGGGVRIAVGDGSRFGRQVAGVGDVDGNGVADVAVGDDLARPAGRQSAGRVTVVLAPDPPKPSAPPAPRPRPRPSDPPRPAAPRPAAKPHAVTVAARRLTARRGGRVRVTLRCAAGGAACTGTARLILGGRWSAPARFALQPGERTTVTVRLRARMRRVLARRGRSRAVLRVATNVPGKPRATQRVNLVLRRAR